jgi:hypothetical protein
MAPHDQDPNRIDVSLNIMSDATLTAVENLTKQLSSLRGFLATQAMPTNPAAQAQSATGWMQQPTGLLVPGGEQAGIWHGVSGQQPQQDPKNPSKGASDSREQNRLLRAEYTKYMETVKGGGDPGTLSRPAENLMAHHLSDWDRYKLAGAEVRNDSNERLRKITNRTDRFFELYPGVTRDPGEDRTYEQVTQVPTRGGAALRDEVSSGASYPREGPRTTDPRGQMGDMPDGVNPDDPGWKQALAREGITPESRFGLTIPRLGEFTIQDKLDMGARFLGRRAARRQEAGALEDDPTRGQTAGRMAARMAYLRDQSAGLTAINREFQRLRGFARGEEQSAEDLGFSRESALGDASLFGAGMRLNLGFTSAAQREGIQQEITQRRVQAAPGVSGEEAEAARRLFGGMGYSETTNQRLQMNLGRPLIQRGIQPETFGPIIDQGVRQGNMSISTLRQTIIDLADAARTANQTLSATAEATAEYAEQMQGLGGNYEESLRNAATFTRSGLDPRIMGQAMQAPLTQGILTAQTGLMPPLHGVIGAAGVQRGVAQSIDTAMAMGQGYRNMPDRTITTASGETLTTATGRDAQIGFAAQQTGLSPQVIQRYLRNPNILRRGADAQAMATAMEKQIEGQKRGGDQVTTTDDPSMMRGALPGAHIKTSKHGELSPAQRRALEHGQVGDNVIQYNELEKQMLMMRPGDRDWRKKVMHLRKTDDIETRVNRAERLVGKDLVAKPEPDYLVGLNDDAKKLLKMVPKKDRSDSKSRANAGGPPANASYQGPNFPGESGIPFQYSGGGSP